MQCSDIIYYNVIYYAILCYAILYYTILCYTITILHNTTRFDNKVRELIAVKVLHISLLNTTAVAFKVLHLGSYAPDTSA